MEAVFFPRHLAGLIILFTVLTGAAYWAILAMGVKGEAGGPGHGVAMKTKLALLLAGWYGLAYLVVSNGLLEPNVTTFGVPNVAVAIVLPVVFGVTMLFRPGFSRNVDAVPVAWFAGFHALRALFGIFFLAIYEMGALPAAVALDGGYGDIAAGVFGALAAFLIVLEARPAVTRTALAVFSVVGLLDFAIVIYLALTTLDPNAPFAAFYPFMLIPAFVVPLFMLTHVYVLRAMMRELRVQRRHSPIGG
ncbi:MAG: hypothetical protein O7A08_02170 [SAR324 cluster bacterium]|nr:hypothetical protein [SAR324 cluster bacterium]